MFKDQLETVLAQDMDRKKFMQIVVTVPSSAIGVTGLIRLMPTSRNRSSFSKKPTLVQKKRVDMEEATMAKNNLTDFGSDL